MDRRMDLGYIDMMSSSAEQRSGQVGGQVVGEDLAFSRDA